MKTTHHDINAVPPLVEAGQSASLVTSGQALAAAMSPTNNASAVFLSPAVCPCSFLTRSLKHSIYWHSLALYLTKGHVHLTTSPSISLAQIPRHLQRGVKCVNYSDRCMVYSAEYIALVSFGYPHFICCDAGEA